jgi:hypothetical protein
LLFYASSLLWVLTGAIRTTVVLSEGSTLDDPKILHCAHLLKTVPPPNIATLGTKPPAHDPVGDTIKPHLHTARAQTLQKVLETGPLAPTHLKFWQRFLPF